MSCSIKNIEYVIINEISKKPADNKIFSFSSQRFQNLKKHN